MTTLSEIVRWWVYTITDAWHWLARKLLRRDRLLLRSERRFQALVESAPDAIVIVDWHGHVALVNAQAEALFGYERDDLIGQNVTDLIPQRYWEAHREHQKAFMRDPETRPMGVGQELFGLRSDGVEFPVEISVSPLDTEQGLLVSSVIRDITERKRIEAELTARAEALARSNADLEQFAYIASHDLSAPLRVVSGFATLLQRRYEGQLDEDADTYIKHVVSGVDQMQALIDDLLAYSRVRRGQEEPRVPVDTETVVQGVLATLGEDIREHGVVVTTGELPEVRGVPSQVLQLFQNLIGNAVKFRDGDTPEVEVGAERLGEMWSFVVRDNGIGIDAEDSERIFKMFERLQSARDTRGTGIGLAICQRIVEGHGGTIAAAPAPGGGSVFSFTLPDVEAR
ncbi:MAG: PAS domain S-box protein [Thermoleophilaceae bacterium]|nr:PAS domain S-box protein [Thermoleophilaceae bacterium]